MWDIPLKSDFNCGQITSPENKNQRLKAAGAMRRSPIAQTDVFVWIKENFNKTGGKKIEKNFFVDYKNSSS